MSNTIFNKQSELNCIGKYTVNGDQSEANKQQDRVNDHLMICRGVNKQNLFYIFKCPHRGTAKYTQNDEIK